ncbi:hypothetical protein DFQ30_008994, partial [Apophysomyces sp. BC1015]
CEVSVIAFCRVLFKICRDGTGGDDCARADMESGDDDDDDDDNGDNEDNDDDDGGGSGSLR